MIHTMRLKEDYYNYILNGTKRIEIRLNDEKSRKIKIGDTIKFLKYENEEDYFEVEVIGLLNYNSFDNLINDFDISILANKSLNKSKLKNIIRGFYSKEEENRYGVLGIRFKIDD